MAGGNEGAEDGAHSSRRGRFAHEVSAAPSHAYGENRLIANSPRTRNREPSENVASGLPWRQTGLASGRVSAQSQRPVRPWTRAARPSEFCRRGVAACVVLSLRAEAAIVDVPRRGPTARSASHDKPAGWHGPRHLVTVVALRLYACDDEPAGRQRASSSRWDRRRRRNGPPPTRTNIRRRS